MSKKDLNKNYEEYAYILSTYSLKGKSCAKVITKKYFKILEVELQPLENPEKLLKKRVYIGQDKEKREQVRRVLKKVTSKNFTDKEQANLELILDIIEYELRYSEPSKNRYLMFFNYASLRGLRLIGLDKKHNVSLLAGRDSILPNRFTKIDKAIHSMNSGNSKIIRLEHLCVLLKKRIISKIVTNVKDGFSMLDFIANPIDYIKSHAASF